ncbi:hypothetical protein ES703_04933 [subsurface metagenome]
MKTLNSPVKFMVYSVLKALRYPKTPISYFYCSKCKIRFPASSSECPKCHDKVEGSPDPRQESPIPWWGSIVCIVIGIGTWVASATLNITPLGEAARLLVYAPLGQLFGMSLIRSK